MMSLGIMGNLESHKVASLTSRGSSTCYNIFMICLCDQFIV